MSLKLFVDLVLGVVRGPGFTMNSRISLSNWGLHEKAQNMELKVLVANLFNGTP